MSSLHNYHFGQMPTRMCRYNGILHRRLEIGEVIDELDIAEIPDDDGKFLFCVDYAGEHYSPNKEHRHLKIWRRAE